VARFRDTAPFRYATHPPQVVIRGQTRLMKQFNLAFGALVLSLAASGCTVKQANSPTPPPPPGHTDSAQGSPDCGQQQDACVNRCRAAAPDEASRQPCYNRCIKEADACAGR